MAEPIKPRRTLGLARAGFLLAAWVAFWLNTALFPCCEVTAAVLGGHAQSESQIASPEDPRSDAAHSGAQDHAPNAPCDSARNGGPALVGEHEVLTPDRSPAKAFAAAAPVAASPASGNHSANIALARASPPLALRLYLRTQRLLI